jgi:hypothetical protein
MSKRVNATGRHKSVHAPPEERLERPVPHLAFIDPQRYDRLIRRLDERNARFRRKGVNGIDPRNGVPNKRTVWPGQHITSGVCGRPYVLRRQRAEGQPHVPRRPGVPLLERHRHGRPPTPRPG